MRLPLALAAASLAFAGCLTVDPSAPAAERDATPPTVATPPPPSPSPPTPTADARATPPPEGRVVFRESFWEALQTWKWNLTPGDGGRIEATGGYLLVEKGPGATNGAFAGLLQEFEGDVVVDARVWVSSPNPRAYVGVATPEANAAAFYRGAGSTDAWMAWNTFHDGWEAELDVGFRQHGTFYLVRHVRVGDQISMELWSGDGKTPLYRGTGDRFIGDGPLKLHFNIERGEREFMLVDYVEVREIAR